MSLRVGSPNTFGKKLRCVAFRCNFDADLNWHMWAVAMVTEQALSVYDSEKKIAVNSRFSRFLFGFRDACV